MTTEPIVGRVYTVNRAGAQVQATCKAVTQFQAQVELDTEDEPIWLPHSAIGDEVEITADPDGEPTPLQLLLSATSMLTHAINLLMVQAQRECEYSCPKCGSVNLCSSTAPTLNNHTCVDCGHKWEDVP